MAALLLGVPGLRSAAELITDAKPGWVLGACVLELLSCLGYVVLFGFIFGMLPRRVSSRLSLAELAVNSVVSVSGLAGLALFLASDLATAITGETIYVDCGYNIMGF